MDFWTDKKMAYEQEKFARHSEVIEYKKGDVVCSEGDDRIAIRRISMGCLLVSRNHGSSGERVVAPAFRGRTFNVADLIHGKSQVSLTAATQTIVYELKQNSFAELADDPGFLRWCMLVMTQNVVALAEYGSLLRIPDVTARFMALLRLIHFQQTGRYQEEGFSIEWPLSQQVVGQILLVTRPYVNEAIGKLVEKKFISIDGGQLTVHSSQKDAGPLIEPAP